MAGQPLPDSTLAALNDNELEVLRLLASGHTAKSIAASLGRSETAINERLREARRKTGVGSSRELARLLDARNIWDKNIDLPHRDGFNESRPQPRTDGAKRMKGFIAMIVALPVIGLGLAFVAGPANQATSPAPAAQTVALAQLPLAGRWSLDVARIPAEERPQQVVIDFSMSDDNRWSTRIEAVDADGTSRHSESRAAPDGAPAPVKGTMAFIDTVSLRQPEANTLVMTLSKNGSPVATRVYTVAADRQSMTETIIWPGKDVPKLETTYFNRIG